VCKSTEYDMYMEYLVRCEIVVELAREPAFRDSVSVDGGPCQIEEGTDKKPGKAQLLVQRSPTIRDEHMAYGKYTKQTQGNKSSGPCTSIGRCAKFG